MNVIDVMRGPGELHVWVGPFGLHVFWRSRLSIRPDYEPDWRQTR